MQLPDSILKNFIVYPEQDIQYWTTTAGGTLYVPPDVTDYFVICAGAGGGGSGSNGAGAGGGGSGGECLSQLVDVYTVASVTITIGAKGTGGANLAAGTSGGSSSFGAFITASGGNAGQVAAIAASAGVGSGIGTNPFVVGIVGHPGAYALGGNSVGGGGGSYDVGGTIGNPGNSGVHGGGGGGGEGGSAAAGGDGGDGFIAAIPLIRTFTALP